MSIAAVIVLYNPDESVREAVRKLACQVSRTFIVDNSQHSHYDYMKGIPEVEYLFLEKNIGIAAAQNEAIKKILATDRYDKIVFSDQDSIIPEDGVDILAKAIEKLESMNVNVGAVASKAINLSTGEAYPLGCSYIAEFDDTYTEVSWTINSISLFNVNLFRQVGLMDETLFIDGVDCEICWRASSIYGARFFVCNDVEVLHQLGIGTKRIGGKWRSMTPPRRMYYQYRNFFWLMRRKYTPRVWIRTNGIKYMIKMFYYPLFGNHRLEYIKNICLGIAHGLFKSNS